MGDAEIFRRVAGFKLEKFIAINDGVQSGLGRKRDKIAKKAKANLAARHVHSAADQRGKPKRARAKILTDDGRVDKYVVLEDRSYNSGQANSAMSIEVGRGNYFVDFVDSEGNESEGYEVGGMQGTYVLHDAAGLPHPSSAYAGGRRAKRKRG